MTSTEKSIEWHQLAEGDELRSVKTGNFYPVTRVLKRAAGYQITVTMPDGSHQQIIRPTPAEPRAVVRRGPTGQTVDLFVHVFSSQ